MTPPALPEQIELHRDRMWRRDEELRIESAVDAERFVEDVGFDSKQKAEGSRQVTESRRQTSSRTPQGTNSIAVGATHGYENQIDYSTL